jgi:tripartite-type tricarboxylate transporter receptor subunit TctC
MSSHVKFLFSLQRGWRALVLLAGVFGACFATWAQNWPVKPIRLIVPFTPGGVTDTSGRLIAEQLTKRLGQQVVVDNKPGASGNIGTQMVAGAEPDGYTLLLGFDGTLVINPHVFPKVGFDPVKDFAPIGKIGDATLILVANPQFKAKTLREVIELSKSQASGLSYGTSGTGGTPHIAGELLKQKTGANLTHIPYKGGGQAMTDVLGGNIPLVYTAVAGASPHVKSGRLHAIAVSSAKRTSSLPEVPTFMESGISDFDISSWVGLLAPARLPRPIADRLHTELQAVLNDAEVREKLAGMGITATPGSATQFADQIRTDLSRYESVVKSAGIRLE